MKNSKHFVEVMSDLRVEEDEILVSFDVSSLFTNVPIDEAVQVIRDRLRRDETLVSRTTLSPDRVAELLETCLKSTYFCYGGEFYEQREGAAMGSPVSAVVANLYMEFFEELALRSAPTKPRLWKRYVDDTCCIEGHNGRTPEPPQQCAAIHQVHCGSGEGGSLPFLEDDGNLDVTVYRKPTHTDRYLDFRSHHPSHVKRGLVRCLYDRARSITTRQEDLQKEDCHLTKVLRQNGYPSNFIRSSSIPSRRDAETTEEPLPEEGRRPPMVMLPYTEGVSEDIRRVCRKFGMKVVFRSGLSLRSMLTKVKDTLALEKKSKVVYQVPCSCGEIYIWETLRRLETRMKSTGIPVRRGHWRSQPLQNMRGRTTIQSDGRRQQ